MAQQNNLSKRFFIFLLILITFSIYLPSLFTNGFVNWDDPYHFLEVKSVNAPLSFSSIKQIFSEITIASYHPLTILTFAIERAIFGFNPFVFHFDNFVLHIIVSILIFLIGIRLNFSKEVSFLAALLFAVHPMHVESVVWATERKDVLYGTFYLLAVLQYLKYRENKLSKHLMFSIILGVLSVLSKSMALSLPLILILIDWYKDNDFTIKGCLAKWPYVFSLAPVVIYNYTLQARIPFTNITEAVLTWVWTFTFYIQKFVFPNILSPMYMLPRPVSLEMWEYQRSLILFVLIVVSLIMLRKSRLWIFSWAFYFLSIFFLLRFDTYDSNVVADRYMYLPSAGFCFLIGVFIVKIFKSTEQKRLRCLGVCGLVVLLFCLLGFKTYKQSLVWRNSETLWSHALDINPNIPLAYVSRAGHYIYKRNLQAAFDDANAAIKLEPTNYRAFQYRAQAQYYSGKTEEALKDYDYAIKLNAHSAKLYNNRGIILYNEKEYVLALKDFDQAIRINPDYKKAHLFRLRIYCENSQWDQFDRAMNQAKKSKLNISSEIFSYCLQ